MPSIAEVLDKRNPNNPVGERFGLEPRECDGTQKVATIAAVTKDGKVVLDEAKATPLRTTDGGKQIFDEKTGRRVVNPNTTRVE